MSFDKKSAVVSIENETNNNYIIPVDLTNLKAFFNFETCAYFSEYDSSYNPLALTLIVIDANSGEKIEAKRGTAYMEDNFAEKYIKEISRCGVIDNTYVNWSKTQEINDESKAKINYYLVRNLVFLKPKQKINFRVLIDLKNVSTESLYVFDWYNLDESKRYNLQLQFDVQNCFYDFLTKKQRETFSDYKLFTGKIESNILQCGITE
ncbi:hypothetical protein ASG31_10515 [Chryseobacterium sp. Leaf404]|uniref:hypothetical protein n=2 Tax=unclassified Chryseobacterium TaxID=2593645 RepID=UPI0006F68B4A|nr:hypothetical protein [Chryseobacterium sp. Leaf404]KQT16803.1 hypothetical protein ASG31_10515 [Chryseobacterium sp. Leaf404]